jgi:hypothetical protein
VKYLSLRLTDDGGTVIEEWCVAFGPGEPEDSSVEGNKFNLFSPSARRGLSAEIALSVLDHLGYEQEPR